MPDGVMSGIPAAPARQLLREGLVGSCRPFLRLAGWSAVEAAPALAAGVVVALALDRGFLAGDPASGLAWLTVLAMLYVVRALAQRAIFDPLSQIVEPLRDALVRRVVRGTLHHAVLRTRPVDATGVSRLSVQSDTVRGIVAALLRTARPLAVTLLATSAGLAAIDPLLAAIVVPPLILSVALFLLAMRSLIRRRVLHVLAEEGVAATTGSVLTAGLDITAVGAEQQAHSEVERAAECSLRATVAVAWAESLRIPIVLLGGYLPVLAILLASPSLVGNGSVSPGAVVGAVLYVTSYLIPALQMMTGTVAGYWSQLRVLLGRMAAATSVPEPPSGERSTGRTDGHRLTVRDLTFRYGPHADPVLRGLTVTVPEGDHLAVVGPSGVGKSTLAGLLAGVELPTGGEVLLGDRPVPEPVEGQRRTVALVPQEAYVFPGSLRENLSYLAPGLGDSRLDEAVRAVGLGAVVHRLGGYDTELADPANTLSSGERQLIVLARVYASDAEVVILDEATCHLDMATEAVVEAAFAARPGTLLVIAHRLTSAARARRVLLLDGARPVLGSHAELLATSPAYAGLVGHWSGVPHTSHGRPPTTGDLTG